jgi:hypothetical protein
MVLAGQNNDIGHLSETATMRTQTIKSQKIEVRLNPAQKTFIQAQAAKRDMTVSQLVLSLTLAALLPPIEYTILD